VIPSAIAFLLYVDFMELSVLLAIWGGSIITRSILGPRRIAGIVEMN